jgi:hypothetical protein
MKKIMPSIVVIIILIIVAFFIKNLRHDYVEMDGVKYEVEIYNIDKNYSFSLFENKEKDLIKWKNNNLILIVACLEGASFIQDLSDEEMNNLFEIPSKNINSALKLNAAKFIASARDGFGGLSLNIPVKITKVVSAKADGIKYIIVDSEKTIKNAPIKSTIVLIDKNNSWKCMSGKRDPNGDLVHSLNRVSEEVTNMLKSGKIKPQKGDF